MRRDAQCLCECRIGWQEYPVFRGMNIEFPLFCQHLQKWASFKCPLLDGMVVLKTGPLRGMKQAPYFSALPHC